MLEFLLMATAPLNAVTYERRMLHVHVAAASDRVVDGISYTDGKGALSAGVHFSDPSGLFANTELAAFGGEGDVLPAEQLFSLETSVGWQIESGNNIFSVSFLDYRLERNGSSIPDNQGASFGFRRGPLTVEIALEHDRPYYYGRYDNFYTTTVYRTTAEWTRPLSARAQWSIGIGTLDSASTRTRRDFVAGGVLWEWNTLEWQVKVVHARDVATENESTSFLLHVAKPFRLF